MSAPLLQVEGLTVSVNVKGRWLVVLDGVTFDVPAAGSVGLVGESGSGKSMTLRAIIGLLPSNGRVEAGSITFDGTDLVANPRTMASVRGSGITMVFQEPAVALNPIMKVGEQITDAVRRHENLNQRQARQLAVELMDRVGITDPANRVDSYPFELSGGMRQRVMIASAIAAKPRLILCDEPTTALDVTVQAQVMALFAELRDQLGAALLYVTHDLPVVASLCRDAAVLYGGRIMETGPIEDVFTRPRHPYTQALLASTPSIDGPTQRLAAIPGTAPGLADRPSGCPFAPRCGLAQPDCSESMPAFTGPLRGGLACHHPLVPGTLGAPGVPNPADQGVTV
ncbi:MAG: ABC transporter ATP-binding protein [Bifidobacteriaceae bacterium]|jgi:peptide/nickel transport system ATP-binding protein/oligopeptide transport system ATP-binding protein|nr:ABC transporter ATP-binding protein [Bifidobacteriaceae bacterium]